MPHKHDGVCKFHFSSKDIIDGEERNRRLSRLSHFPYSDTKLKEELFKKPSLLQPH